jgi:hypothetical protein
LLASFEGTVEAGVPLFGASDESSFRSVEPARQRSADLHLLRLTIQAELSCSVHPLRFRVSGDRITTVGD